MRPIILTAILVATIVISQVLLLNDNLAVEAYNDNNLYRPYCDVGSYNLDQPTKPAYVDQSNENSKQSYDWAI